MMSKLKLVGMSNIQGASQPKMWRMRQHGFGGAGTSTALITCHNDILGKSGAVCTIFLALHQIWRH